MLVVVSFISKLSCILVKNSHYVLKVILLLINCNLTFLYVPLFTRGEDGVVSSLGSV